MALAVDAVQQKIFLLGEAGSSAAEVAPSENISHSGDATIPAENAVEEKTFSVDDATAPAEAVAAIFILAPDNNGASPEDTVAKYSSFLCDASIPAEDVAEEYFSIL